MNKEAMLEYRVQPIICSSLTGNIALVGSVEECDVKDITSPYNPEKFYGIGIQTARIVPDPESAMYFGEPLNKEARFGDFASRCETVDFRMMDNECSLNGSFSRWFVENTEGHDIIIIRNRPIVAVPTGQSLEGFIFDNCKYDLSGEISRGIVADALPSYVRALLRDYLDSFKNGNMFGMIEHMERGEGISDLQLLAGVCYARSAERKLQDAMIEGDLEEIRKQAAELQMVIRKIKGLS